MLLHLALFTVGAVAGLLNVLAGGGSFLTLPMMIFMGLPATVANATNRIGIVAQNIGAAWGFHRHGVMRWRWALHSAVPASVGAVLGTWGALVISDQAFETILALLMVTITLWSLARRPTALTGETEPHSPTGPLLVGAFFLVGVYGGFVQAGVGFLILAATSFAGLDLVRGNAVKVLNILLFTVISLAIFAWQGQVDWAVGATLAAGNVAGAALGVRLTVLKGHRWLRGVVAATAVAFAVLLLLR